MTDNANPNEPMAFLRSLWGSTGIPLPGLVVPSLDIGELDKRIADLKAVEGWLDMNLNMLRMGIQGLEMQRATLTALNVAGHKETRTDSPPGNPFANPSLWPWNLMSGAQQEVTNASPSQPGKKKKASPPG